MKRAPSFSLSLLVLWAFLFLLLLLLPLPCQHHHYGQKFVLDLCWLREFRKWGNGPIQPKSNGLDLVLDLKGLFFVSIIFKSIHISLINRRFRKKTVFSPNE